MQVKASFCEKTYSCQVQCAKLESKLANLNLASSICVSTCMSVCMYVCMYVCVYVLCVCMCCVCVVCGVCVCVWCVCVCVLVLRSGVSPQGREIHKKGFLAVGK